MLVKSLVWLTAVSTPLMMGSSLWKWREGWSLNRTPAGIASGNGRVESIRVDIATKYAGRVGAIAAREGDMVRPGQIVARMNTDELEAERARALAKTAETREVQNQLQAEIREKECRLRFAHHQFDRDQSLFARRMISRENVEQSQANHGVAVAALEASRAKLQANRRTIEAAAADVARVETQIADSNLVAPVEGRILYRLAEEGEVLPAGGKVFTLVNLGDVYMEIFLPARDAARASIGAEARVVTDLDFDGATPATVSYVSPEAQFTPNHVETQAERDKLMFRVKLQIAPESLPQLDRVKTGVRGLGFVKLDDSAPWPETLERRSARGVAWGRR